MNTKTALAFVLAGVALLTSARTPVRETKTPEVDPTPFMTVVETETDLSDYYPTTGVITDLEYDKNLVVWEDFSENEWDFEGTEDFTVGDRVALIMCKNGTTTIYDDYVVKVKYCGWDY